MVPSNLLVEQVTLLSSLAAAFALALLYLRWRGHLSLLSGWFWLPALLVVGLSVPDALATLAGTWGAPAREADPFLRFFLTWDGWPGLCLALALWMLGWALALDGLETLRLRLSPRAALLPRAGQLYILYALAVGHLDGFAAWTHVPLAFYLASNDLLAVLRSYAAWTMPSFAVAYVLYPSLVYGALCALLHLLITTRGRHLTPGLA